LGVGTGQLKLRVALLALVVANLAALYFYLAPPGGTQEELAGQDRQINNQIAAVNVQGSRLKMMAARVESGSTQASDFQKQYFLPKRVAYSTVIEEIHRMAKLSGLQEKDAGFTEEPIEGTADLSLLNIKANYEGTYPSLMRFLYESDQSPMLLMLDTLTATPQQKDGQISTEIRYQVVIQDPSLTAGFNPVALTTTGALR